MEEKDVKKKEKDEKIKQNEEHQKQTKRKNTYLKETDNSPKTNEVKLNPENEESAKRNEIYDTIFIYVLSSPCAKCLSKYMQIINEFSHIKIHVFYSQYFYFEDWNIVFEPEIKNTQFYKECYRQRTEDELKGNEIGSFKKYILDCINSNVIDKIKKQSDPHSRLFFHKIMLRLNWRTRMDYFFKLFGILNQERYPWS